MTIPKESVLEFSGVEKSFGSVTALKNFSLSIPAGCVFALLGPNGAGKSTVAKLVMGLHRCDRGVVRVLGRDVLQDRAWARGQIGYVPELHFMYRWMRVREVIWFCAGLHPTWNWDLCRTLVDQFGIPESRKIRELSKGMTVKLALLLALSHEPTLLIMDEPTSGLDPLIREELLDGVLRALCDGKRTVLLASHTLVDVQRLADRVGILFEGELLVNEPVEKLMASTRTVKAVLTDVGTPRKTPAGTIFDRVEGREWCVTVSDYSVEKLEEMRSSNRVERIEVECMNLEEIFKAYVRGRKAIA